jgi:hypothetical protein
MATILVIRLMLLQMEKTALHLLRFAFAFLQPEKKFFNRKNFYRISTLCVCSREALNSFFKRRISAAVDLEKNIQLKILRSILRMEQKKMILGSKFIFVSTYCYKEKSHLQKFHIRFKIGYSIDNPLK